MAYQDIVCAGWVDSDGVKRSCGKHLGRKETTHPGVTHSLCDDCATAQMEVLVKR